MLPDAPAIIHCASQYEELAWSMQAVVSGVVLFGRVHTAQMLKRSPKPKAGYLSEQAVQNT